MRTVTRVSIINNVFGRLKVKKQLDDIISPNGCKVPLYLCKCSCGGEKTVRGPDLKAGRTKSCGCLKSEVTAQRNRDSAPHGYHKYPEYKNYRSMIGRCYNKDGKRYADWGGRGIRVCKRWRNGEDGKSGFECFYEDMGPRTTPKHQIDRIDNDKNYSPKNCKWSTIKQQANNRRSNINIAYHGKTKTLQQWTTKLGLNYKTIQMRVQRGWEPLAALTTPV